MRSAILLVVLLAPASLAAEESDHAQATALFSAAQTRLDEMGLPRREPAFAALRAARSALEGRSAVSLVKVTPLQVGTQVELGWQGPKGHVWSTLIAGDPHVAPEWRFSSTSADDGHTLYLNGTDRFPSVVMFRNRPGKPPAKVLYTASPDGRLSRELGVISKVRMGPRARDGAWRPGGR